MKMLSFILLFLAGSVNAFAFWNNSTVIPEGSLVFGQAQELSKINLRTCDQAVLYRNERSMFSKVTKVDQAKFLFLQDDFSDTAIKIFDLKNNTIRLVYKGAFAPYYNKYNKKLFFDYVSSYKTGPYVYVSDLDGSRAINLRRFAIGSSVVNDIAVIPVSKNEIVFNYEESENHIDLYNMVTDKLKKLPIKNCHFPQLWRSATKQLLCYSSRQKEYFLTSLDGAKTKEIKKGLNFSPVLYMPKYDEMLYTTTSFSFNNPEEGHLGIYDFKTGDSKILCNDINLGIGYAAYYPNLK